MRSTDVGSARLGLNRKGWVDLARLYRLPSDDSCEAELLPRLGEELYLQAKVPGTLHEWTRSAQGLWVGVVDFAVPLAADRSQGMELQRQLVPAYALRPMSGPPLRAPE